MNSNEYFCIYYYKNTNIRFILNKLKIKNMFDFYNTTIMKSFNELISIIIPTYNRSEKIYYTILSLLNQSYKNIEIIVVDDGSEENIDEVINKFNDTRIKFIKNKINRGCWHARNTGIQNSNGKYIIFNDSDDISTCNRVEVLYNYIKNFNLLFIGSQMYRTHIKVLSEDINTIKENVKSQLNSKNIIHNTECCKKIFGIPTIMYDRKVFENVGLYNEMKKGTDSDFLYRLCKFYNIIDNKNIYDYISQNRFNKKYCIIEDVLYYSSEFDGTNITSPIYKK